MKQLNKIIFYNLLQKIKKTLPLLILLLLTTVQESFAQKDRLSNIIGFQIDIEEVPISNSNDFLHHVSILFGYYGAQGAPVHGANASIYLNFVFLDQNNNIVGEYEIGKIDIFGNSITTPIAIGSNKPINHYILYPQSCNIDISTATSLRIEHEFDFSSSSGSISSEYYMTYNNSEILNVVNPAPDQLNEITVSIVNQLASNVPLSLWGTGTEGNVFVQPIDCGFSPNMQLAYVVPFGGCPPYTQTWTSNNGHTANHFVTGCNWNYDGYDGITLPVYGLNQETSYTIQIEDSSPIPQSIQTAVQTNTSCHFLVNTLEINDNPIPTGQYINSPILAYNNITSTGLVASLSDVIFISDYIYLNPGFVANYGSTFLAQNRCQEIALSRSAANRTRKNPNLETTSSNTSPLNTSFIQNIPNPFSNHTTFDIQLAETTKVNLEIYDVTGKLITVILDNQTLESGQHKINFDANNLSSGIYLYRLATKQENITKKMVLKK